jgi:hypothetical protein
MTISSIDSNTASELIQFRTKVLININLIYDLTSPNPSPRAKSGTSAAAFGRRSGTVGSEVGIEDLERIWEGSI